MFKLPVFAIFWLSSALFIETKHTWDTPRCQAGDVKCLPEVMTYYIKNGGAGMPSMNLIPIDPLFVPEINIIQGTQSPVNIKLNLRNSTFYGLSNLIITRAVGFDKDLKSTSFEYYGTVPKFSIIGEYEVSGSVIVLPVVGNGPSNLTFENVDFGVKFFTKPAMKKNKEFAHIDKLKLNFNTTRLYMNFENLYNGDKLLGDTTNKFLNENWADILGELKPVLADAMAAITKGVMTPIFDKFAYNDIFLQDINSNEDK